MYFENDKLAIIQLNYISKKQSQKEKKLLNMFKTICI